MDVRFDAVTARQTATQTKTAVGALQKPAEEPGEPARDANDKVGHPAAVTHIDDRVQNLHRELRFRVDETTGLTVVRVVEAETGDLIRQIPSRNVLEMHAARELNSGLLLSEQA